MQIIKIIKALNYKANNYQNAIQLQSKGKSPKKKKVYYGIIKIYI